MKNFKRSILTALLLSFVALLAVGCGDSREDFVATNTNNANTGALNFQFVRARTTTIADATTDLLFEFRNTANELVLSTTVPFASPATTVTITGIPTSATQVEITALQNGFPVGSVNDTVTVQVGQTGDVDLTNATNTAITFDSLTATPDPTNLTSGGTQTLSVVANFSDTSSVTVPNANVDFSSNNTNLANVSAAGVVSSNAQGGNTTVNAAWTFNSVTRNDEVVVTVGSLTTNRQGAQEISQGTDRDLNVTFFDTNGGDTNVDDDATFTIVPTTTGVSMNGDNVDVAQSVPVNTTFTVQASYTDPTTGVTHTASTGTFTVVVDD